MKKTITILGFALVLLFGLRTTCMGQTTLNPGDVVILEFNGNGTDGFTFMPLVDLSAGTTIHFTDYGWTGSAFNIAEDGNPSNGGNMITYTAPSTITAGTLIRQNSANIGGTAFTATAGWSYNFNNNNFITSLNTGGTIDNSNEGLFIFQGTPLAPTFIWGYHTGQWGHGAYLQNFWSELPSPLVNGTNAVFFPNIAEADVTVDDGYFNGPYTAASAADWLARVSNSANWTTSSLTAPTLLYPTSYTVISTSVAPTVTTQAVSSIASTTATGNGNVISLGSPNPTAHGVCWNTTGTPTISDSKVDNGGKSATGAFTASMTSLSANTTYYVRAYATNTGGTSYGTEVSFTTLPLAPTVTTQAVSSIGTATATGNGNITSLGGPNPTAHGVCWNTTGTPSILDSKVDNGAKSATGAFTASMTSLSANTTYYVRAYATNTAGTSYGSEVSFTTSPIAPTVTTQATSSIGTTTALGNGTVTSLGVPNPTAHGVCWNTTGTPTVSDSKVDNGAKTATGAFTASITSLSANTTYYVRAYATNTAGTSYGTEVMFTTSPIAPTVTTQAVSSIAATTATGNGNVTSLGVPNPTAHGVCWNTTGTPTVSDSKVNNGAKSATGAFTASMTSLSANTTYHVRAYATNTGGTSYGTEVTFTTSPIAPTVTTQASSSIGTTTALGNGTVTSLGVPNPTAHGVCWNTTGTPTVSDSKVDNGAKTATGAFTASMTSLSGNTTYYVRAYATNAGGTSYGTEVMFTTSPIAPTVTTQAVSSIATTTATGNGNVTSLGAPNPSAHGVCWNTTGTPTVSDSKVNNGTKTSTGTFTASMTSLSANTTYHVRAYATNIGGTSYGTEVTFTTLPINNAPTDISLSANSISENVAPNSTIGTLSTTDPDAGDTFAYTLVAGTGSTDNASFNISGSSLRITNSPDFETKSSYTVRVRSTDQGSLFYEKAFTITINDLNEAPTDIVLSASSINENVAVATPIGDFSSIDPDAGETFTYSLVAGSGDTDNGAFIIGGNTLAINTSLNYETKNSYSIRVRTSDGVLTYDKVFTITINNVNETPSNIALSANSIGENVVANSTVGTLSTTDPDAGNTFAYTLVAGTGSADNASFNISGSSLHITNSPDFETKSSYTVRVRSTDQGSLFYEKAFTITINDLNEVPTNISLSANSINENIAANSTVGTLTSTDPDAGNTFAYTLVAGTGSTDNASFNISGSSLHITNSPDFETKSSYTVRVRTTDQGSLFYEKAFTITINDLNEAPTDISLSASSISENVVANSTIGTLSTTDPDAGNTFAYTLVAGTGSTDNASFNISGSSLRITNSPDFETKSSYTVRVRSTDQGSLYYEKALTITINDMNETPTDIVLSANSVNENVLANSAVGLFSTTDPDAGNTFTYSLVAGAGSTDNASFNISGNSLLITSSPDFETKNSYSVRIRTTDQGSLTFEKVFTITINDVNETPVITAAQTFTINENLANSSTVGSLVATDQDAGTIFSGWAINGGNTNNAFTISASTGVITVNNSTVLDRELVTSYNLTVTVSDGVNTSAAQTVMINLTDLNDVTPVITAAQTFTVNENLANNSNVGTVVASDGDATATIFSSWTITGGNTNNAFAINASTGVITVNNSTVLDRELVSSYSLTVTVSDGVNTSAAQTVVINLTDLNDEIPVINTAQVLHVTEQSPNGTTVGTVIATDEDITPTTFQNWTITAGNSNGYFAINSSTGVITVVDNTGLDPALNPTFTLTLTVSDGVNTSLSQTVTIIVDAINDENPVITTSQSFSIDENSANSTVVGQVLATDPDYGTVFQGWSITSGNTGNAFAMNSSTGEITVNTSSVLDYEGIPSFSLSIEVSDGLHNANGDVTITLNNVNETPTDILLSASYIDENVIANSAVGTLGTMDPDAANTFTYTLVAGVGSTDNASFNISGNSLMIISSPDFETKNSYSVRVRTEDQGTLSYEKEFIITINDLNESPTDMALSASSIDENVVANSAVGNLSSMDADVANTFTYTLVAGVGSTDNASFNVSGNSLQITNSPDFETKSSYSVRVRTEDQGGLSFEKVFTITINDLNESPTDIALSTSSIDENVVANSAVGNLSSTDADAASTFTYTLATGTGDTDNASFNISGNSLEIIGSPDFETKSSYSVRVRTEDQGSLSFEKVFTITINNVNDNAPDIIAGTYSIDENSANGTSVGTITATDADGLLNSLTFSITSGNTNSAFAINPTTGEITVNATGALDFETNPIFDLTVSVSDGTNSDDTIVTIHLNDVVETGFETNTLTNLKVYPNPASDQVSIDLSNKSMDKFNVEILDVNGSKVYQSEENSCSGMMTIKLNGIATGVYILRVYNNQSSCNYKLIIQK